MNITFVRPNLSDRRSADAMEPLVFGLLKARTPRDVGTRLLDERLEPLPVDDAPDLAAITVETYTARRAYEIADAYRARGVRVVLGGFHPTLAAEEAAAHADAIVIGDGESVWRDVVEDARREALRPRYEGSHLEPLEDLTPDRSIFAGKRYRPTALVQFARGCRFHCDFCSIHAFYGTGVRHRPISEVVAEIESLDGRVVFFVDDNLFVGEEQASLLFEALEPLGIAWACQTTVDVARNPDLVRRMARSGCIVALVGFESLRGESLREMRKGWALREGSYERAVRIFRDNGIMVYGTFVFGYDHDAPDSFDATLAWAVEQKLYLANFNPLTPTPGTTLYRRLREESRLLRPDWWVDPDFRYGEATFRPRGMTARELTEGCFRARRRFHGVASIARRLLDRRANLRTPFRAAIYLRSNLVSRREVIAKQGRRLGSAP